jgi:arginine decarboxylase
MSWTNEDSFKEYGLTKWGDGYFSINQNGHVAVHPRRIAEESIDLFNLVQDITKRGLELPLMLRFDNIIESRIERIYSAFEKACKEYEYQGDYRLVYPIKVNQQRHVVDTVLNAGKAYKVGLEVGSKPELLAVLAVHENRDALLLCNGYKDREYIELAFLASKLGLQVVIVVEQFYEVDTILEVALATNHQVGVGLRMKPISRGSGKWSGTVGERAKFGLHAHEMVRAVQKLQDAQKTDWVKLLHFHMGSQLSSMVSLKRILHEGARTYVELAKLCPNLELFDVGGGLGIDYEGSSSMSEFSRDYSLEEYARNVVWAIQSVCDRANIAHPTIVTESGRATVAQHSLLVTEIIDVSKGILIEDSPDPLPIVDPTIEEIYELYNSLRKENCVECLHDASHLKEILFSRFLQGALSLELRGYGERICNHVIFRAYQIARENEITISGFEHLEEATRDTYFCNFSIFQSLPDYWAIGQPFPIMPIHRLDEEPEIRGILADLTCDSDGKIERFVSGGAVRSYLPLHKVDFGSPYYLGIFLTGAYQEILGDLHNLFGDANAVHVSVDKDGMIELNDIVEGDTVREVLHYVQYDPPTLIERFRRSIAYALKMGKITPEESAQILKRYRSSLEGYTYLVV